MTRLAAQCSGGANSNVTITPCYGISANSSAIQAGQYLTLNVVKGVQYEVKTCGQAIWNTELTVLDNTGALLSPASGMNYNNDNTAVCGILTSTSALTFQAPYTGSVRILLTSVLLGNCQTNALLTSPLTITALAADNSINTIDNPATAGTNTWVGHVYDRKDAGTLPSDANAFTRYLGTIPATETFTEGFGGAANCFNVNSQGNAYIRLNSEYFALRYRMQSSRSKGCYVADITADDGVRLTVDGVKVFDRWIDQGLTTFTKVFFSLTGSSNMLLEYYESAENNTIGFTNFSRVSNLLTANTSQTVCQGTAPAAITGNNTFTTAPLSSDVRFTVTYQWQRLLNGSTWANIDGATGQNFTPADTAAGTYYYRRLAHIVKTNEAGIAITCDDESSTAQLVVHARPTGTLSGNTICEGQQGKLTFNAATGSAPFSLVISGSTYNNVASGTAFNTLPNPVSSTSYHLTKITDNNGCIHQ